MGRSKSSKLKRSRTRSKNRHRDVEAPITVEVKQKTVPRYRLLANGKGKHMVSSTTTLRVPVYGVENKTRVCKGYTRITFAKKLFTTQEAQDCYKLVSTTWGRYWVKKVDKARSTRPLFTLGRWCSPGHFRFGMDVSFPAGEASKSLYYKSMIRLLKPYTLKAEAALRKYRPELIPRIMALPESERPFGLFTIVMAAKGTTLYHTDRNDLISVMLVIHKNGKGAQFDVGGTDYLLNPLVGDAIIADGSCFVHGNRKFWGKQEDRVVILFIVHETVCKVHGV
jgi:hypothetical protein